MAAGPPAAADCIASLELVPCCLQLTTETPCWVMAAALLLTRPPAGCLQHDLLSLETCYRFLRLPAGLYGHKPFSRLMQRGLARLVEEFGDLDEVWTDEERQAAFLAMPLEALQVGLTLRLIIAHFTYLLVWGLLLLLLGGLGIGEVAVHWQAELAGASRLGELDS